MRIGGGGHLCNVHFLLTFPHSQNRAHHLSIWLLSYKSIKTRGLIVKVDHAGDMVKGATILRASDLREAETQWRVGSPLKALRLYEPPPWRPKSILDHGARFVLWKLALRARFHVSWSQVHETKVCPRLIVEDVVIGCQKSLEFIWHPWLKYHGQSYLGWPHLTLDSAWLTTLG